MPQWYMEIIHMGSATNAMVSHRKPFLFCRAQNRLVYVEPRTETIEKTTFLRRRIPFFCCLVETKVFSVQLFKTDIR